MSLSDSKDHYSGRRDGEQDIIKLCSSHHLFPPPFVMNGPNDPIWQTLRDPVTGSLQRQKLSCSYEQGPKPVRTYLLRPQSAQFIFSGHELILALHYRVTSQIVPLSTIHASVCEATLSLR